MYQDKQFKCQKIIKVLFFTENSYTSQRRDTPRRERSSLYFLLSLHFHLVTSNQSMYPCAWVCISLTSKGRQHFSPGPESFQTLCLIPAHGGTWVGTESSHSASMDQRKRNLNNLWINLIEGWWRGPGNDSACSGKQWERGDKNAFAFLSP